MVNFKFVVVYWRACFIRVKYFFAIQKVLMHLQTYPIPPPIGRCTNCGTGLGCGHGPLIPGLSNGLKENDIINIFFKSGKTQLLFTN